MSSDRPFGERIALIEAMAEQIRATPMPATRSAKLSWPRSLTRDLSRPGRLAAATTLIAAIAAIVLVLSLSSAGAPPPAFAATLNTDHTVTITLREMADISKLDAKLVALGVRIRVVPVVRGCVAPVRLVSDGRVVPAAARTLHAPRLEKGIVSQTLLAYRRPGRTLVIADTTTGMVSVGGQVVIGPAPHCVAYPAASNEPLFKYAHK